MSLNKNCSASFQVPTTKKVRSQSREKLTFSSLVLIAFNYMVNISLAVSFAGIVYGTSGVNKSTIGYHIF